VNSLLSFEKEAKDFSFTASRKGALPMSDCGCMKCQADRIKSRPRDSRFITRGPGDPAWRYACEICGNKRAPHHSNHNLACTASNEDWAAWERIPMMLAGFVIFLLAYELAGRETEAKRKHRPMLSRCEAAGPTMSQKLYRIILVTPKVDIQRNDAIRPGIIVATKANGTIFVGHLDDPIEDIECDSLILGYEDFEAFKRIYEAGPLGRLRRAQAA
jgi:hypothetical protein